MLVQKHASLSEPNQCLLHPLQALSLLLSWHKYALFASVQPTVDHKLIIYKSFKNVGIAELKNHTVL